MGSADATPARAATKQPRSATEFVHPRERWVGSVRRECLDRLLIGGRRQLEHVLGVYVRHYNRERPHRAALDLQPPDGSARGSAVRANPRMEDLQVTRRELLGGLIHEYEFAA